MNSAILVSDRDNKALRELLNPRHSVPNADRADCLKLLSELDRATVVPVSELPPDVVCLGAKVDLESLTDGLSMTFTLVMPYEADPGEGLLSVLAPLGTGLLGYRVGDEIEWPVPSGRIRVRICSVEPPADPE
ncbi:MAG TPA: GreA/GreB family elongation factor [Bacteroidia bacterium]|nr:GreA/GreB family elongation factor [Bacteroidia bacterium]